MTTGSLLLEMAFLRETLEDTLAPKLASKAIFEALEGFGDELPSGLGLARFVDHELKQVLQSRLGQEVATDVIGHTLKVLRGELHDWQGGPPEWVRSLPRGTCVRVAVVSGTSRMDTRLLAAMGAGVMPIGVHRVSDLASLATDLRPQLVLIDGADPPADSARDLVEPLRMMADDVLVAVYGTDDPWVQQAIEAMSEGARTLVKLNRRAGVNPLLDPIDSLGVV